MIKFSPFQGSKMASLKIAQAIKSAFSYINGQVYLAEILFGALVGLFSDLLNFSKKYVTELGDGDLLPVTSQILPKC